MNQARQQFSAWIMGSRGLLIAVVILFGMMDTYAQKERKAKVKFVIGDATFQKGKSKRWRPIRVGANLTGKDVVRTMVESRVEVELEDGTSLTFEENSVVELSSLFSGPNGISNTKVNIKNGKVLFNVKKLSSKKSDFTFETPTATAAIRGTKGGIGTKGRKTFAYLEEGKLELTPKGGGGKGITIGQREVALQSSKGFEIKKVNDEKALQQMVATVEAAVEDTGAADVSLDSLSLADSVSRESTDTLGVDSTAIDTAGVDTTASVADSVQTDSIAVSDSVETLPDSLTESTTQDSVSDVEVVETDSVPIDTTLQSGSRDTIQSGDESPEISQVDSVPNQTSSVLFLDVTSPADGAEITTTQISIQGVTAPSATVTVRGKQVVADGSGSFSLAVSAPATPGEYSLLVSAKANDKNMEQTVAFSVPEAELVLSVNSPSDGEEITGSSILVSGTATPGAQIQVLEASTTADESGVWSVSISAPSAEGDYTLPVSAQFGSQTQGQDIAIVRIVAQEPVTGSVDPVPGLLEVSEIVVSGTCNDGAKIEVAGFSTTSQAGRWKLRVTWPETQEGEITLPVYCSLNGEEVLIGEAVTEYRKPVEPLVLNLSTPQSLTQSTSELTVSGVVKGMNPKVEVDGAMALVMGGSFNSKIRFSELTWDKSEVVVRAWDENDEINKTINITVDKASRAINTSAPRWVGEPVMDAGIIRYSLQDTPGDECKVTYLVDGNVEDEREFIGSLLGQSFAMVSGSHDYRMEAVDMAGNVVIWERRSVGYYPRVDWTISMISPRFDVIKRIPPSPSGIDWEPSTDVRFRVQSLPDDDYRYLKQVTVRNENNGHQEVLRDIQIDDVEFEFEVPLVRNSTNTLRIIVEPKTGPVRETTRTYSLK